MDRRIPSEDREGGTGWFQLGGGDQEGQAAGGGQEFGGCGENFWQAFDSSEGYYVEGGWGDGLGTGALYIDVRQCKGAGYFAEEGCLLVVGFDQSEGDVWGPDFYRDAWEAGTGAQVGDAGLGLRASGFA